jgi:hypothetical protein
MSEYVSYWGKLLAVRLLPCLIAACAKIVFAAVYSTDGALNETYVATAQTVLRGIAGLADELSHFSGRCFGEISRVAARLGLAYHQVRQANFDPVKPLT